MARSVLITGIAGFLGSHIADAFLRAGDRVSGIDNLSGGSLRNIPSGAAYKAIDCTDFDAVSAFIALHKPDVIYHCAALAHEGLSVFSPATIGLSVYQGSVAVFSAAAAHKVRRVVFTSSMARYGHGRTPFSEGMIPAPVDPYGIAKVAAEDTLRVLGEVHRFEWVIAVPHNIIGPRQKYDDPFRNVASIMINRMKLGLPVIVYGDGRQTRCFSPIRDCLHSLVLMADAPVSGEIINIGPDNGEISILDLAELCASAAGVDDIQMLHHADRPREVRHANCSSDKARRLLGFTQQQSLMDCLREMAAEIVPKPFEYHLPIEIINELTPRTWRERIF